jgi:hypothetical protein
MLRWGRSKKRLCGKNSTREHFVSRQKVKNLFFKANSSGKKIKSLAAMKKDKKI